MSDEKRKQVHRETGRADPSLHLLRASEYDPGHPIRDSHERVALVSAIMLLTHRVGELARIVHRQQNNGDKPDA